ncbi:MAG: hypothetical protein ACP5LN_09680 [Thermoproteota archaeon]
MKKSSPFENELPLIYVLNNLEKPEFAVDLWELFGSEDNFHKALVGKWDPEKNDFKEITWDWPLSNMKHVFEIFHFLSCMKSGQKYTTKDFDQTWSSLRNLTDLVEGFLKIGLKRPILGLYVMRYRKQFPALLIELKRIEQDRNRNRPLLITFVPRYYFILDAETWHKVKVRSKKLEEWIRVYRIQNKEQRLVFKNIFCKYVNMKQAVYGLVPRISLFRTIQRSTGIFLYKSVEPLDKSIIVPDNMIFWELFHEITRAQRERYTAYLDTNHSITDIPIDALSKNSNVYKHEAGVANVLTHILLEIFGDKYLQYEFDQFTSVPHKKSKVFRREFQVKEINGEENNPFKEADYDYALKLEPLGINALVLADLTTALWRKGLLSYEEYIERWKETCFNIPTRNNNVFFIWHIVINDTEENFFDGKLPNPTHSSFDDMLKELSQNISPNNFLVVSKEDDINYYVGQKIVIIKIFNKTKHSKDAERELNKLLQNYKQTLFYKVGISVLKHIVKSSK